MDSEDTLNFSALTGVKPMTEVYPLEKAAEAYDRMMSGKARFRVVVTTGALVSYPSLNWPVCRSRRAGQLRWRAGGPSESTALESLASSPGSDSP